MYGLVNKAIKKFVISHHGNEVWEEIYQELGLSETQFLSMESNPDEVTFRILNSISDKSNLPPNELAEQIGEYFFSFAGEEGFGDLMELSGDTMPELLQNLNDLHFRVKILMPDLNPPRFEVSEQTEHSLKLHYYSSRDGLDQFLIGVLKGIAKKFDLDATMTLLPPVDQGEKCIVLITWK